MRTAHEKAAIPQGAITGANKMTDDDSLSVRY
jgi:hypothetical protein